MKTGAKSFFLFLLSINFLKANAQKMEPANLISGQLEAQSEKKDEEPDDDSYEMDLETLMKNPLNLNMATEEDLIQLHMLSVVQIKNFISYRKMLGPLLSLHELQAVPGWELENIRQLLPFVKLSRNESLYSAFRDRWTGGDNAVLVRVARVLEKSRGYNIPAQPGAQYYMGSPTKLFLRYTYNYKQLLFFGFSGEKDAGEPFFRGTQKMGFDFYSFHFLIRRVGILKALAIGDFTVSLGQGLIQWQAIAFTKSSQTLNIKRESSCLNPYRSTGEFNFHRGIGISLEKGNWQTTLFFSARKISTNQQMDTVGRDDLFSSFENSGYHRTLAENADRNNCRQISGGGNVRYSGNRFSIGINGIFFRFNHSLQKQEDPYNLYSQRGKKLSDYSIDYNYTHGNMHLFGEFALDNRRNPALVQGLFISLNERTDLVFLYRNISPAFQSLYSDAFTENTSPNNERGFYCGFAFKPLSGLRLNIYYDIFDFPWLKYQVDAPSSGREWLSQVVYQPNKNWQLSTSFKNEFRTGNTNMSHSATHEMVNSIKQRWRVESEFFISRNIIFSNRMEFVRVGIPDALASHGFLGMAALRFSKRSFAGNLAFTVFETADYDTRIYTYEADVLYGYSIPAFYGKGFHYIINLHQDFSRLMIRRGNRFHLSAWMKWEQTFYPGVQSIGSGLDEIQGNRKTGIKLQVLVRW
jgi:Helix-hairpin-helix motif